MSGGTDGAEHTPVLEGHISKAFDGELAALHLRVIEMGGLVLDQVRAAARAYTDWDQHAATAVIERAAAVTQYEQTIDREQFTLIARRQPVSRDLRAVFAMAKSVAELERAGAEARKIALTVLQQSGRPARAGSADARQLAHLATNLLRLALESLDRIDAALAAQVIARDDELDSEYAAGLRRVLTHAMEDPRHLEATVEAAFVLKSLERIGAHARLIARHVRGLAPEPELAPHTPGNVASGLGDPPSATGSAGSVSSGA
jgi:phosphate transport system protein